MTVFIRWYMAQLVKGRFILLLFLEANTVHTIGKALNISFLSEIPQEHCRPCPILHLSVNPDAVTPIVNDNIDIEVATASM